MFPIEILCEKVPKYTKMNHKKRKLEENNNYIIVKYGAETTYEANSFKSQYRQSVDYIKYNGENVVLTQDFTIKANDIIQIYLSQVTILEKFFYDYYDPNVEYISSIDLTHFNTS